VMNLDSGLVRQYIDGAPETATVIDYWRLGQMQTAFALKIPGLEPAQAFTLAPRIIYRELSEVEIAQLKPNGEPEPLEASKDETDISLSTVGVLNALRSSESLTFNPCDPWKLAFKDRNYASRVSNNNTSEPPPN